ncbi:MAG: hypothetical protein M3134_07470, partial [Actinomycetota bacterium]|nr:hypothetical protein [Actinomycetota bacterium]
AWAGASAATGGGGGGAWNLFRHCPHHCASGGFFAPQDGHRTFSGAWTSFMLIGFYIGAREG